MTRWSKIGYKIRLPAITAIVAGIALMTISTTGAAVPRAHTGAKFDNVNVGIALTPPKAVFFGPYVADREGFFTREHIHAHFIGMPNGLETELGTTTGQINIGFSSATDAIESAAANAPIHLIWSYSPRLDTECIGAPGIKSVKDLIGKNVGTTGAGGFAYTTLKACLAAGGVKTSQVHLVTMTRSGFVPAMINGTIQAAVFHIDDGLVLRQQLKGTRVLEVEYKTQPKWWYGGVTSRDDWLAAHKGVVRRFLTAMVLADRWMYTHKSAVVNIGVQVSGEDRSVVSKAYDFITKGHLWEVNSGINKSQIAYTSKISKQLGDVDRIPSFRAIVNDAFIKQVLKKVHTVNEKKFPK